VTNLENLGEVASIGWVRKLLPNFPSVVDNPESFTALAVASIFGPRLPFPRERGQQPLLPVKLSTLPTPLPSEVWRLLAFIGNCFA
jgi:hypothetical protein